nr:unnamed protein product [Digitaria exilis]
MIIAITVRPSPSRSTKLKIPPDLRRAVTNGFSRATGTLPPTPPLPAASPRAAADASSLFLLPPSLGSPGEVPDLSPPFSFLLLLGDPGDFSLGPDDGEEGFGVVPYSSESDWSDEDVVLTAFGDVELPVTGKSRAEGALKIHHFRRRGKPVSPSSRKPTPAMGGLFFVPIGIFVARREVGFNSNGVNGAAMITLIFAMLGLLDDISSIGMDQNRKIPQWIRLLVQIVAGIYFSVWLGAADISTPYSM